jgi:hypothetical protein
MERDHSEDIGLDGRAILELFLNKQMQVDWMNIAQDRDRWQAAGGRWQAGVKIVMKLKGFINCRLAEEIFASLESLCCLKLPHCSSVFTNT